MPGNARNFQDLVSVFISINYHGFLSSHYSHGTTRLSAGLVARPRSGLEDCWEVGNSRAKALEGEGRDQ